MSHAHGAGHGHDAPTEGLGKYIAIFISVLALFLAIAETFGKSAQTTYIAKNVEASNLWAFFQAKTIRRTAVETAADALAVDIQLARDPATKQLLEKRVADWKAQAQRYRTEPETGEGSQELAQKAKAAEKLRDLSLEKYHHFEVASAAFQIAIVLAGAYLLVKSGLLLWLSGLLACSGIFFTIVGFFFPSAIHLF
ncbi:MAG: DUF4337 domain-containing protein [Hyphomicrobiaceae bacterium]